MWINDGGNLMHLIPTKLTVYQHFLKSLNNNQSSLVLSTAWMNHIQVTSPWEDWNTPSGANEQRYDLPRNPTKWDRRSAPGEWSWRRASPGYRPRYAPRSRSSGRSVFSKRCSPWIRRPGSIGQTIPGWTARISVVATSEVLTKTRLPPRSSVTWTVSYFCLNYCLRWLTWIQVGICGIFSVLELLECCRPRTVWRAKRKNWPEAVKVDRNYLQRAAEVLVVADHPLPVRAFHCFGLDWKINYL